MKISQLNSNKQTCLLAKTSKTASLSSSSASIRINSSRASPTRSLSLLSTTKIKPSAKDFIISYEDGEKRNIHLSNVDFFFDMK